MNRLSTERRAHIVGCLVEGMSLRATSRITGAARNTLDKLLPLARSADAWFAFREQPIRAETLTHVRRSDNELVLFHR